MVMVDLLVTQKNSVLGALQERGFSRHEFQVGHNLWGVVRGMIPIGD